jgi:hypothetical protein
LTLVIIEILHIIPVFSALECTNTKVPKFKTRFVITNTLFVYTKLLNYVILHTKNK